MGNVFSWLMSRIIALFVAAGSWVFSEFELGWEWAKGIAAQFVAEILQAIVGNLPTSWHDALSSIDWKVAQGLLADVSWILPVQQCLAIVIAGYVACAVIRLLRWVKSCIPTISGA